MPKQEKNVRRAAVSALRAWAKGQDYADSLVDRQASKNHLSKQDRALLNSILMAVLRHRSIIDHWIGRIRSGKLDKETKDILRVGVAQLMILKIPDHAAVNETVNCGRIPVRGLINAVLRKTLLLRKRFLEELEDEPLPLQYSHPEWLWKRWKKSFGEENTISLAEWNNDIPDNFARINPLISNDFDKAGYEVAEDPRFIKLDKSLPYELIQSGALYVQDLSTRHAIDLLAPEVSERILDACAAPGGKAAFIAGVMGNKGELICTDSNEKRLPRLKENIERLGVTNADILQHDWLQPAPKEFLSSFDAILADVPCSNTGVMKRRVDVRWRLKYDQFAQLNEIQTNIVENLIPCLKPGGRLVYSTCSIDDEENSAFIKALLEKHEELELVKEVQVYPFEHHTDGAYAALIQKK